MNPRKTKNHKKPSPFSDPQKIHESNSDENSASSVTIDSESDETESEIESESDSDSETFDYSVMSSRPRTSTFVQNSETATSTKTKFNPPTNFYDLLYNQVPSPIKNNIPIFPDQEETFSNHLYNLEIELNSCHISDFHHNLYNMKRNRSIFRNFSSF